MPRPHPSSLDAVTIDPPLAERVRWMLALSRELGAMAGDGRRRLGRLIGELHVRFDATASCATSLRPTAAGAELVDRVEHQWTEVAELCRARSDLQRFRSPDLPPARNGHPDGWVLSAIVEHDVPMSTRVDLYRAPSRPPFASSDTAWVALILESALAREVGPRARVAARLASLSQRERETLDHLLAGAGEKQVAALIGRSQHTVHAYVKRIYRQMNVTSRAELLSIFVGDRDHRAGATGGREM